MRSALPKPCHSGLLAVGFCLAWSSSVWPQSITATLPAAGSSVAVNKVTNKVYVVGGRQAVTVIDGPTNTTITVPVAPYAHSVAVDELTNRVYIAGTGKNVGFGSYLGGGITVVDGATNSTTTVIDPNAKEPYSVAVNRSTNRIYVANSSSANVTVIDGVTNSTVTVTDPNAKGLRPSAIAINPVTNKIYVANNLGSGANTTGNVTVIDGATNATITVSDPNAIGPNAIAVNTVTDKIYVTNGGAYPGANHGNVTIIDGATNSTITVTDPNVLAPQAVAVDQSTNKIYVANANDSTVSSKAVVTVIDGATNSVASVIDPNATFPDAIAVDEDTNMVYVANGGCLPGPDTCGNPGSITVINEGTNSTKTLIDPKANTPWAVAVDPLTDRIYVANVISGNLSVIDGGGVATSHTIAVLMAGSGSGTVTSSPSGVDCGTNCTGSFAAGTAVSLFAAASSGSVFSGWSGSCGGIASCDLAATEDQFVTATFSSTRLSVPNVVGQTQSAASTTITGSGLVVGTVTQQPSSTVASGDVISESPAAGTEVASGSAVDLVVSSGDPSGGGTGGSHSGGGGIDILTLGAILGSLLLALGRAGGSARRRGR